MYCSNRLLNFIIGALLLTVGSCDSSRSEQSVSAYYDLRDLITAQIIYLNQQRPKLIKSVTLDGEEEQISSNPDSSAWASELEIILENNINVPALVGAFREETDNSNLYYYRIDTTANGVMKMSVEFDNGLPERIEINTRTENALYSSNRTFNIYFEEREGKSGLKSYEIMGQQTILGKDRTNYTLKAQVSY